MFAVLVFLFILMLAIAVYAGMSLIVSGMFLGCVMLLSVGFTYCFWPKWVQWVVTCGPIAFILDLGLSWGITYGLGYSVTGFTAAITFGLLLSFALRFEHLRVRGLLFKKSERRFQSR